MILERFLGFLVTQQILSSRSWVSIPSLLSGFITIVGGVHVILVSEPGSKISFVYLLFFIQFHVPCCVKKKKQKNKTKKEKKKTQNSSKKKNSSFQSCFSKKIVLVPER
jgi:flagellar biosynthesis component FlhA